MIVPVYNGGVEFARCLAALYAADPPPFQVIVVDDGSDDESLSVAAARGAQVVRSATPRGGPARARNLGAANARGDILFFIDADVQVALDVCARLKVAFADLQVSAVFGSYDDAPAAPGFIAQYKNLLHHYTHQTAQKDSASFWAGCGAIRAQAFASVGGFSAAFSRPSIEDIELGYRLRRAGYTIRLDKTLQVKHLKAWTLRSLLTSDIRDRALPWTRLLKQSEDIPRDLNLQASARVSAGLCWLLVGSLLLAVFWIWGWMLVVLVVIALLVLNAPFYQFLYKKRGVLFLLGAVPLHWLFYLYSSAVFAYVWLWEDTFKNP